MENVGKNLALFCCAFALVLSVKTAGAAPLLFPYGLSEGDSLLPRDSDDISAPEVRLMTPVKLYNRGYETVYVNQNGLVSFLTDIPTFVNIQFPLDYPSIAPLYSDVDTRISGEIYYRETQDAALLERAKEIIKTLFSAAENFEPTSLFIATWSDVGYFDRKNDLLNTYQLVVASDGQESYALMYYDKIEWVQGTGKNPSLPDAKAQAGIVSGYGPYHTLKGSGTDQVSSLHKRSNFGEEGVWAFRVGGLQVQEPDLGPENDPASETSASCAAASTSCHSKGKCIDYDPGFCCVCGQDFYGNGRVCLQKDIPQRVSGKVRGVLNGVSIDDSDLFSYVIPQDGRAYTAISKIPERLGYDLQTVSVLGTVIGWLFSTNVRGAPNGFQFTGGVFNYTAEISFYQTGQKVTVNQHHLGLDVFSNLHVETRIHGATPVIPLGKSIEINDFEMQFTRVVPGVIRSRSSHVYVVEGTSAENPFTIEQTIEYNECPWAPPVPPELEVLKMVVGRNYIVYDANQQISRYATTTAISPTDGVDPCKENKDKCGPNSSCVVEGDNFKCICNLGYQEEFNYEDEDPRATAVCADIDECGIGISTCDATAICINTPGSYECQCQPGYSGDGYSCKKELSCSNVHCAAEAECVEISQGSPECRCLPGYYGDGVFCYARRDGDSDSGAPGSAPDCRQVSICDPFADCIYSRDSDSFVCSCRQGYTGSGDICMAAETESCDIENKCHRDADCKLDETISEYVCVCRSGFIGDGLTCRRADGIEGSLPGGGDVYPEPECFLGGALCNCPVGWEYDAVRHECNPTGTNPIDEDFTCDVDPGMCDRNANCVQTDYGYTCICKQGFSGDGRRCSPQDSCLGHSECSQFGVCAYQENELRYSCKCRDGFEGNGKECRAKEEMGCDVLRNCDVNAKCNWDPRVSRYSCECKPGFRGDGITCEEDRMGCNVLKNCDRNADCLFDPSVRSFRCICRDGYDGDGLSCRSARPCYEDRSVCDPNAECSPLQGGREWKCQCLEGWQGNGMECEKAAKRDGSFLLVTKGMSIIKAPTDGQGLEPLAVEPFQTAVGIDIDCPGQAVYWGDVGGRAIKTMSFNGSGKATFLEDEIGSPEGISVDWASHLIYWTDSMRDTIEVANLETKLRKTLISNGLVNPRGIAIYPQRGRLFWSDWNRKHPKIEYSGLDGNDRDVLVGEGLALPNSLVVDTEGDALCWADADTHKIECIGIDGRNRRVIVTNVKYPFGLALSDDIFYWTDWQTKKIESASKANGKMGDSIAVPLGGTGKLYGLVLVPPVCPAAQSYSPCGYNPCGSDKLCLPSSRGGISCVCPNSAVEGCEDSIY